MSYDPKDYHFDLRSVGSGWLLAVLIFCGMGVASVDLHGTVQAGWTAVARETPSKTVVQCT
ncbi:hypothetical protein [Rhizobium sp. BK379]|uniref:hypothetical protein n=1 Tax=Rhizobium sp. BK379 TaxID=2587059 RepID=UPI0016099BF2|nr:hypothetical protein [Rhizobium sp. BK379]MBB3444487.1 hypothetical protein [Rhizobium sp. BK379]